MELGQGLKGTSLWRRLYWCHQKLIFPRRNEAAEGVRLGSLSSGGVEVILRNGHIPCVIYYYSIGPGNELSDDLHGGFLG